MDNISLIKSCVTCKTNTNKQQIATQSITKKCVCLPLILQMWNSILPFKKLKITWRSRDEVEFKRAAVRPTSRQQISNQKAQEQNPYAIGPPRVYIESDNIVRQTTLRVHLPGWRTVWFDPLGSVLNHLGSLQSCFPARANAHRSYVSRAFHRWLPLSIANWIIWLNISTCSSIVIV